MTPSIFVACYGGDTTTGQWGPVGRLDRVPGGYRFLYTRGAQSLPGFVPFAGMTDLHAIYESDVLFPLFANRLLTPSRRQEYEAFLTWGGFDPRGPLDPIAVLGITEGRRATDSLELFPCPQRDANGSYVAKFFLHGVRWFSRDAVDRIDRLQPGESLGLMLDVANRYDAYAVAVRTCDTHERCMIGYVPRYLAQDVWKLVGQCGCAPQLTVERINSDAPLQQRVLCRMRACWPEGFHPCTGEAFEPIADVALAV